MNTTARLTVLESVVARLADRRGERVSAVLELARKRVQAGEPVPAALHTVAEFEHQARQPGIAGRMGRARLRLARGIAPEALLPGTVEGKEAHGYEGGRNPAVPVVTAPTGSTVPLAATSVSDLVGKIDALVGRYA